MIGFGVQGPQELLRIVAPGFLITSNNIESLAVALICSIPGDTKKCVSRFNPMVYAS